MLSASPASNQPGKASTKRSLFAKPSWSKTQNLGSSDLFRRSDQTYIASTADAERKRKEKFAKKGRERAHEDECGERASKRQRILGDEEGDNDDDDDEDDENQGKDEDDEDDEDDESSSDKSASHVLADKPTNNPVKRNVDRPNAPPSLPVSITSLVDNYQKKITERTSQSERQRPEVPNVIDLDDEESSVDPPELSEVKFIDVKEVPRAEEQEVITSDEEFPELARKARERARRKRFEQDAASLTPNLPFPAEQKTSYISSPKALPPPLDPVLQILITSSIPNTSTLIVSRKLGQRLKDVRLAWANRQQFSSELIDNVFLTWRGKRLFDVTTCKSLGVTVDLDGRVLAKGDVLGDDEGRIHMEAMTSEILEARRKAKKEEQMKVEDKEAEHETQRPTEDTAENQVRIILKAKGFEEFKLKVKPVMLPISQHQYSQYLN